MVVYIFRLMFVWVNQFAVCPDQIICGGQTEHITLRYSLVYRKSCSWYCASYLQHMFQGHRHGTAPKMMTRWGGCQNNNAPDLSLVMVLFPNQVWRFNQFLKTGRRFSFSISLYKILKIKYWMWFRHYSLKQRFTEWKQCKVLSSQITEIWETIFLVFYLFKFIRSL